MLEKIREYLQATGTDLYTVNSDRVCIGKLPISFDNTESGILIQMQSVETPINVGVFDMSIVFRLYGGDDKFESVIALFERLHSRLNNGRTKEDMILAYLVTANMTYDPDTQWPVMYAQYRIQMSD